MLPRGWDVQTIDDIATVSSGGTPSRSKAEYWDGEIPWATTAEIQYDTILDTSEKITQSGLENSSAKLFPSGTILMAMYGQGKTRGKVAKLGIESTTNQACAAIQLKKNYLVDFYFQFLQSQYENIRKLSNTGSQENLNAALVKSLRVPVPPFLEQKKIAKILSAWDQATSTLEKLLANSQQQKKALMQRLLTGKQRLPNFQNASWTECKFRDIFDRITTRNTNRDTNVLTISGRYGLISQKDAFNRVIASDDLSNYILLKKGDFAFNKSYSIGYPYGAIKPLERYAQGVVSALYICFGFKDTNKHNHDFFRHFFEGGYFDHEIYAIAQEGARNHGLLNVSVTDFFNGHLRIPSFEEQIKIANVINKAEHEVLNFEGQLKLLTAQKKALMQQLLTGKRRVKVDES